MAIQHFVSMSIVYTLVNTLYAADLNKGEFSNPPPSVQSETNGRGMWNGAETPSPKMKPVPVLLGPIGQTDTLRAYVRTSFKLYFKNKHVYMN